MFPRASMLIRIAPHADGASSGAGDAYAPRECCRAAGAELAAEGRGVWHKHEGPVQRPFAPSPPHPIRTVM